MHDSLTASGAAGASSRTAAAATFPGPFTPSAPESPFHSSVSLLPAAAAAAAAAAATATAVAAAAPAACPAPASAC